jgi:predicted transposase YdaD
MMRESVIYQEILQEGEERGLLQGQRSLILRMLEQKIGSLSQQERDRISALNLEQLGNLALPLAKRSFPRF